VHDSCARRHNAEAIEGPLRPTEELVALRVALIFARNVLLERLRCCPSVNLHGVIDDEIGGHLWVDALRIDAELARRIAQRGKVNDRWDASEILEDNASRREGEFALIAGCGRRRARLPCEVSIHIFWAHKSVPGTSSRTLNEDLQDDGESLP